MINCPVCGFELKKKDLKEHLNDDLNEANDMEEMSKEMKEKIGKVKKGLFHRRKSKI